MKNWPFPRQSRPGPILTFAAIAGALILFPIVFLLFAFFGIVVWGFWTDGTMGKFAATFMVVALAFMLAAIFTAFRRV